MTLRGGPTIVETGDDGKEKVLVELPPEVGKTLRGAAAAVLAAKAANAPKK